MSRVVYSFMGAAVQDVSFDPEEFRGKSTPQITEEIKKMLRDIRPDVDFFEADIEFVAERLANEAAAGV